MKKALLYVGLDVDDTAFHVYGFDGERGYEFRSRPNYEALVKKLNVLKKKGYELRICYEAAYIGYFLCRLLREGGWHCEIVATSLVPKKPGFHQKTDRIDSKKLAEYYEAGLLTLIHIPSEEDEYARDLVRSSQFLIEQRKSLRAHIISICRRLGWSYRIERKQPGSKHWTQRHREWLRSKIHQCGFPSVKNNLTNLLTTLMQLEQSIEEQNKLIEELSQADRYRESVNALRCFKGIKIKTAMVVATELGDIRRFSHPRKLTSYVGFDVYEFSSGAKERKFSITRRGNKYLRTAIIESIQTSRWVPKISEDLRRRRKGCKKEWIDVADRCMNRLYKKAYRLIQREKNPNKIKVACAREMLSFIWELLYKIQAPKKFEELKGLSSPGTVLEGA